jgi:hypothetical protein
LLHFEQAQFAPGFKCHFIGQDEQPVNQLAKHKDVLLGAAAFVMSGG